jgi:transketolase
MVRANDASQSRERLASPAKYAPRSAAYESRVVNSQNTGHAASVETPLVHGGALPLKEAGPTNSGRVSGHVSTPGSGPHFWKSPFRDRYSANSDQMWSELRRRARLRLLRMHFEAGVGHIGGNLSCLDLLLVLYHQVLDPSDQFILSKGHAAGALYVTLWTLGKLSDDDLATFHQDSTLLSGHPPVSGIDGILFATGSLGHGLSLAAGLALAKTLKSEAGRVICLTSDGEWNEGSCWEALIFARHHHLANLTVVVDLNGLQGFGATREVANLDPLAAKFRAFQVPVQDINGHDAFEVRQAIEAARDECGISFMEDRMEWHYLSLTENQYMQAVKEVDQACEMRSVGR